MRLKWITAIFIILYFLQIPIVEAKELETVIIEVEGDVEEYREYIETYHPFIEVVASYSTLFQGLALQGKPEHFKRISEENFIKGIYDIHTYEHPQLIESRIEEQEPLPIPKNYTGKNVKVAVIDTGVDYTHPDLAPNYSGGYDLFDLDENPMETLPEEGMPTVHGTHVAGIIAANGEHKGVAREALIYAYRALGPGGYGSTVHVLAALEQAVRDRVDIINLSLGNNVNGPDYPTSTAVNKAVELGIPVVIANGNSGPAPWTVGSPATAKDALSVGAIQPPSKEMHLIHAAERKEIQLIPMLGAPGWNLTKDYAVEATDSSSKTLNGKIALIKRGEVTFRELAQKAEKQGAIALLIYNNEPGIFYGAIDNHDGKVSIPVASISEEDGKWLLERSGDYLKTIYQEIDTTVADFSSRGPVTVNWQIKPDITAPGTAIKSTVPGGYEQFSGTSMAAPYVAGVIALMKEAHPTWNVEKMYSALKTTAEPLKTEEGKYHPPSVQGHGLIQPEEALDPPVIIYNGSLEAGKISNRHERTRFSITIENRTEMNQHFSFNIPKNERGISWQLPLSFQVPSKGKKDIELELEVASETLQAGIHEGYLELVEITENQTYHLTYLFINQHADQPKIAGLEFQLKQFSEDTYKYSLYATEELKTLKIDLYDLDMLTYRGNLLNVENPIVGINEGEIPRFKLPRGNYLGLITAIGIDGTVEIGELLIYIE